MSTHNKVSIGSGFWWVLTAGTLIFTGANFIYPTIAGSFAGFCLLLCWGVSTLGSLRQLAGAALNTTADNAGQPTNNQSTTKIEDSAGQAEHRICEILLVEDVTEIRMMIEITLKRAGYTLSSCENGAEAVELCKEKKFDIIFMDLHMPVMDGFEAARQIRKDGENIKTHLVALTAAEDYDAEMQCVKAGYDDFVTKPISKDVMLKKVERFLRGIEQIRKAEDGGEIVSSVEEEQEYQQAVDMFVENLPERIDEINKYMQEGNFAELSSKIHALKGLGGFAGFPIFTQKAREIEDKIKSEDIDELKKQIDSLVSLCRRTKKSGIRD